MLPRCRELHRRRPRGPNSRDGAAGAAEAMWSDLETPTKPIWSTDDDAETKGASPVPVGAGLAHVDFDGPTHEPAENGFDEALTEGLETERKKPDKNSS